MAQKRRRYPQESQGSNPQKIITRVEREFRKQLDKIQSNFIPYTRKAFGFLPKLGKPQIVSAGCHHEPTLTELAQVTGGRVVSLDQVTGYGQFDIAWLDQTLIQAGFVPAMMAMKKWLKPGGFAVIHDIALATAEKVMLIKRCGFSLRHQFALDQQKWHHLHDAPVRQLITDAKARLRTRAARSRLIESTERALETIQIQKGTDRSVYYVVQLDSAAPPTMKGSSS